MVPYKPFVFIGCSNAGQDVAEALQVSLEQTQLNLGNSPFTILENQSSSGLMKNKLNVILEILKKADYGIAIFTKEDIENLNKDMIFLLGLMKGQLGNNRYTIFMPENVDISSISLYLSGLEPNRYNLSNPSLQSSVGPSAFEINKHMSQIGRRLLESDYIILNNKKRLLVEALESYNSSENQFNPLLSELMDIFEVSINTLSSPHVLGATLFMHNADEIIQIGSSGRIKSSHKFSVEQTEMYVVQCYLDKTLTLGEKKDRLSDGGSGLLEYIYCAPVNDDHVLTVHINCSDSISSGKYDEVLRELERKNAGYISILQLLLKGGIAQ